jgi:hypothetical protein
MSEPSRDKDTDLKKKSFFSHSFVSNPLKSGSEEGDPHRFLHRQKSDFSTAELQELQQKLERWVQESKARRVSYDGFSGIEFNESEMNSDDRTEEEFDDGEL